MYYYLGYHTKKEKAQYQNSNEYKVN